MKKSLTELLRVTSEEVQSTTSKVVAAMREETAPSSEYGEQVAQAIRRYGESVAEFIRGIGEQAHAMADSYAEESNALSDNIKKAAELEAERCLNFTVRMRDLGRAMSVAKKEFETAVSHPVSNGSAGATVDMGALEQSIQPEAKPQ